MLAPGKEKRIRVTLRPGAPGPFLDALQVEVGHFAPLTLPIAAMVGFACAALDLPRLPGVGLASPEEWVEAVREAKATVAVVEAREAAAAAKAAEAAVVAVAAAEEARVAEETAARLEASERRAAGLAPIRRE